VPYDDPETGALRPGTLLRFAVTALNAAGVALARRPKTVDTDGLRVFKGTVLGWRELQNASLVPALHWYTDEPQKARGDEGAPGSMAFDAGDGRGLRFYDRVSVHRQGSGRHDGDVKQISTAVKSKDWPKRKFEVAFESKRFVWRKDGPPVKRISLRSMFKARA
jgi:hypothetical protein